MMNDIALNLLDLPHEVLHSILLNTDPQDLANICCCHALSDFIRHDRLLYKELYLRNYDEPPPEPSANEIDWSTRLKELVKLRKILESEDTTLKTTHQESIVQSVDYLLSTAAVSPGSSLNVSFLTQLFGSRENIGSLLCGSKLFEWARREGWGDLSRTRLRRNIITFAMSTHADQCITPADLEAAGFGMNVEYDASKAPLAHVVKEEAEDRTTAYCTFEPSLQQADNAAVLNDLMSANAPRQLSAKLHCLYGVSIDSVRKDSAELKRYSLRNDFSLIHPYARSLVYDLRQHTDHTFWGPFKDDGSQDVDWEKMEAIMIVLDHNMKKPKQTFPAYEGLFDVPDKPFVGAIPKSFVSRPSSIPIEPALPLEAQDPYNVTGTWMRIICFLDYTELYQFNFESENIPDNQPRKPIDIEEAIRFINMKIHVTKVRPPGEEDGQRLPVVHFSGTSSSLRPSFDPNANSKIRGTVRLTPQGEVRWTSFSIYHGEERWKSEGIQVGGVQSSRGVLGYWFDKDHDEHGPAGPTAFWKAHDGVEKKPAAHSPMSHFTMPMY